MICARDEGSAAGDRSGIDLPYILSAKVIMAAGTARP